jgi:hypothetical protein
MILPNTAAVLWRAAPLVLVLIAGLAGTLMTNVAAQTEPGGTAAIPPAPFVPPASTQPRMVVLISDLRFGLGKSPDGQWSHKEDFRWPGALKGFLDEMEWDGGFR